MTMSSGFSDVNGIDAKWLSWACPPISSIPNDFASSRLGWAFETDNSLLNTHDESSGSADFSWLESSDGPCASGLLGLAAYPERKSTNIPAVLPPIGAESSKIDESFEGQTCLYLGCPDADRMFKQSSAFKKHMDKHLRPYACPVQTCKVNRFATPGDLRRHEREVHAAPAFICPIPSCKRHRRGFSRKDNLVQHMRRTHDQENSGDVTSLSPLAQSPENDFDTAGPLVILENASNNINTGSVICLERSTSAPSDKTSLMSKLQELEMEKEKAVAKFDGDIEALKRVLSFV